MDIDTNWCLNCGKQTNGELYCSSQCRNHDEKNCKQYSSSPSSDYGSFNDNDSIISGQSSPTSYTNSSKYLNNPGKLLYYQGNDLKFRNRPSYDSGFYNPCLSSGLSQWINQNTNILKTHQSKPKLTINTNETHNRSRHIEFTNGFRGSFSSASSDDSSYSSSADTMIMGSSSSSNNCLNKSGLAVKEPYYPWNKIEEDDDISLYEY
ncbi:hypothetical protein BCR32DRAFT_249348 [Anaeromyces robustus]|jgi:hypothetical protein|uniref:Uncharacterized protein n=1 Tax=Anaeromyces robustus TaxID=1754192 RepID=A0A1Y1WQ84_9FUNG|nr:hypothetical protein BCR32DRAFT_249348 [Anaeromyces robustus]|eukprot:ORX75707.1 hypothetical protein BCR32DRAFT_249348 [Anaeromyces robustus]